ncbi:MAG: hypothetical protein ABI626_03500 [Sphingomicrobium sp.]
MDHDLLDYEQRCEQALADAGRAFSHEDRLAHLEQALRFAQLATRARQSAEPIDLMRWRCDRAPSQ